MAPGPKEMREYLGFVASQENLKFPEVYSSCMK